MPKGQEIYFYNTKSRSKELFRPKGAPVKLYTCGPTVYNFAHIGNFRTYVFEDILRRTLKYFGYEVHQVMNLTDIDDKTIRGAIGAGSTLDAFTEPYINAFFADIASLGIERAENYPRATDYIPHMIDFIQKLLDKEVAYASKDGSIYFSIDKFSSYGALSHLKMDENIVGKRVAMDEYDKDNVSDFVLWKAYDPTRDGEVFWESPFGRGRPGWHLECSTMAMNILGDSLDIHTGAVDNIFPHHENEIAQSEALSGKPFVALWMHSEHLLVDHKKMSKSLGNFYSLRDLLDRGYQGREVRYMLMHTHYRTQLNFTLEGMEGAKKAVHHLMAFWQRVEAHAEPKGAATETASRTIEQAKVHFGRALADDLNISAALAAVFDLIHALNGLYDRGLLTPGDAHHTLSALTEFNRILGIWPRTETESPLKEEGPSQHILELFEARNRARQEKNYALADSLRGDITKGGYLIEDTPYGPKLKKQIQE